jgi:predicted RNase H-like HicB family nuclease
VTTGEGTLIPGFVYAKNKSNTGGSKMKQLKIIVEKHPDNYVAYPLGLKGVVIGQGKSYEAALKDVKSAIKFHLDTFQSGWGQAPFFSSTK